MIKDGEFVILKRENSMRVVHAKKNGRPLFLDRTKFFLDNIFEKPYGSQFEIEPKTGRLIERAEDFSIEGMLPEGSSGLDNRNLVSANEENQNLGKDEIQALRKDGLTGDEVMTELIKNSATFNQKTKFSQEKWIKKKKKRHMNVYTILKPCTRLLAEMYYNRDPSKICFLRMDTLAQMLTLSDVQASSKVLLVEACQGLVAGAILDRLCDTGCLTQLFTGPNPMKGRNAFDDFGFSKDLTRNRMKLYPLNLLHGLSVFSKSSTSTVSAFPTDMQSTSEPAAKKARNDELGENCLPNPVTESIEESSHVIDGAQASLILRKTSSDCQNVKIARQTRDTATLTSPSSEAATDINRTITPPSTEADSVKPETGLVKSETSSLSDSYKSITTVKSENEGQRALPVHLVERQAAKLYMENTLFDTLVVAVKARPTQLVLRLLTLIKMSRPFVVFHQHKEPLLELFVQLKERGGVVNLKLTETWFRTIQVLPERTHPAVNMSGTSGYLLTGTTVERC